MADSLLDRAANAWSVFLGRTPYFPNVGIGESFRPDRYQFLGGTEGTTISSIYTRIGIDVAAVPIRHVRRDKNENYIETIDSGLNKCLSVSANLDQTGRALIQDIIMSLCDEGSVAIVPVETSIDPKRKGSYEIISMRTAKILEWYPAHVRVDIYNQRTGIKEELILPKEQVVVIENPLFAVMNEPNSTLKRLASKIAILDAIDNESGSGKLDIIIQLPYVAKTPIRQKQAEDRRATLEAQLKDSRYGISYIDGAEKITQLNRPAENNLMAQIEYLTSMLYSQLGMTSEIFEGGADESMMLNYYNRTIEPIMSDVTDGMSRIFLTPTARTQGQAVVGLNNLFKFVPAATMAELADKFTRNEILSSNEIRGVLGYRPSEDPKADELRNKNLNEQAQPEEKPNNEKISKGVTNDED